MCDPQVIHTIESELLEVRDGWDGRRSRAPRPAAIKNFVSTIACLPEPDYALDRNGDITARWFCSTGQNCLSMLFRDKKIITFVAEPSTN